MVRVQEYLHLRIVNGNKLREVAREKGECKAHKNNNSKIVRKVFKIVVVLQFILNYKSNTIPRTLHCRVERVPRERENAMAIFTQSSLLHAP